jgi:phenylacetate-coenzyme A ligase PaaK-like adenylate-forming protein
MGECLFLTNGCLSTGGMHVNADWAILEVVDENNQPVPDGQKGAKVLITNLANYIQPIIRYEIGDVLTMASESCGCGSNLPLIEAIDGRDSDMFYIERDGALEPLPPAMFEVALGELLDAREYQIVQEQRNQFRVRVEPLPGVKLDAARARKIMQDQLAEYGFQDQLQVDVELVDKLAPEGADKFKRIVSKVEAPTEKTSARRRKVTARQ